MFDERGNVVERLDSSGAVLTRHAYTAYGRDYTNTNPSNLNLVDEPWGFGAQYGYYTDRETNYIYCTFRYYDPALGRWLNRDPAGYGGGLNLYKYCGNNPINRIDPLGLSPDDPYDFSEGDIPTSNAQMYARAGSDFANDKMWKGGSCQRKEFSQGISMIPVVGNVNQAVIAATGYDYIAGSAVTGQQRALAVAVTALGVAGAMGDAIEDIPIGGSADERRVLVHYTTEEGHDAIVASEKLKASTKALRPRDARYGDGQYLTDILPGTKNPEDVSRALVLNPNQTDKFTHYIEIDVTGLNVVKGRENVFVVPNSEPLDLTGRIVRSGKAP